MKPRKGREDDASGKLTTNGSEHESDGNGTGVAGATVSLWYEFVDAVHALRRGTLGVQQPCSQRELTACVLQSHKGKDNLVHDQLNLNHCVWLMCRGAEARKPKTDYESYLAGW